ncbi:hypothetical protein ACJIZ3_021126 [Penstemon smallii]|uniref:Uncharacterized protein n=1 Tax=Penstemon smallii TaxID=265156 RepID=A0ABD3SLE2_9LAMI
MKILIKNVTSTINKFRSKIKLTQRSTKKKKNKKKREKKERKNRVPIQRNNIFVFFLKKDIALPSFVLGKVKDFLGIMSESNKKLLNDAKENPNNYDIEVLNGKESEYIELAVAAAESAIAGKQPVIHLPENSSSGSDSDDTSDDDEEEEESVPQSAQVESTDAERDSSRKVSSNQKPKKRPKIVELP